MKIDLSITAGLPGQDETTISVAGDVITIDEVPYDLSAVPEGGEAYDEDEGSPLIGKITRTNGVIHCTVLAQLGDTAESNQSTDPAHWVIEIADGPVVIPAVRKPEPQMEEIPE